MEAPDKIYVASYNGEAFSHSWTIEPLGDTTATEYIRKDALMEWAKETYLSENASAIRKVCFKQLVEKLMSM